MNKDILKWLLSGDVSIQYQVRRDLLGEDRPDVQQQIATEGWGARFLAARNPDGSWGRKFYQPKWTSTHYTLLDLKTLGLDPNHAQAKDSVRQISLRHKSPDGGVNPSPDIPESDVCLNGMFLNYACYFKEDPELLESVVDFVLDQQMHDGGFNCRKNRWGARHSSLHSTLSVLEGLLEYARNGYTYRLAELDRMAEDAREFILQHRFFLSDRTGEVIKPEFLRLAFPPRWKYNILRALDYFRMAGIAREDRMKDALEVLSKKRRKDGRWPLQAAHPGKVHFKMEETGKPSRWNTLVALRVLRWNDGG